MGGQYTIVFNGEIYNFIELREELKTKGYIFHTHSDTEVVLASYDCWGEQCLNRFNGMWALAIWDHTKKRLFLSRDRFGKKPLFYAFIKDRQGCDMFVFASEMKAIYPYLREIKPSKNFSYMSNIAHIFDYEQSEHTLIDGICRFPHSHYAYYDPKQPQNLRYQRYYCILDHLITPPSRYEDAVERFRELFLESVSLRMRSDVSIGTALSGGVDSSSTICAMAYLAKQGLKTESKDWQHAFVACFKDTPLDESPYAKAVVDHIGINATFLEINPLLHWDKLEEYFYLFEDVYITSPIPMIATYQGLKQHGVSVTLDGHGADELFSGYGHLIHALWDCKLHPRMFIDVLQTLNQTRAQPVDSLRLLCEGASFVLKTMIKKLIKRKSIISKDAHHPNFHKLDYYTSQLYIIFYESILPTLLRNYDRYSMINGVEIRMPFMDHKLVEFVFSLPFNYKFGGSYTKRLIRDSVDMFMPKEVTWRKSKIGFNSPIIQWIQRDRAHNGLKEWFLDIVHSQNFLQCPLLEDSTRLQQQIINVCDGKVDSFSVGEQIWCALNPYIWSKSLKYAVRF